MLFLFNIGSNISKMLIPIGSNRYKLLLQFSHECLQLFKRVQCVDHLSFHLQIGPDSPEYPN